MLHVIVFAQIEHQDPSRRVRVEEPVQGAVPRVETHLACFNVGSSVLKPCRIRGP